MIDKSTDRNIVAKRLAEDLIGPKSENEELSARPSDFYLTGILWPQRISMMGEDDEKLGTENGDTTEEGDNEKNAVRTGSIQKPSVAGLSFSAASSDMAQVRLICNFATYRHEIRGDSEIWVRQPYRIDIDKLKLIPGPIRTISHLEIDDNLPEVSLSIRCLKVDEIVLATISLVNSVIPGKDRNEVEAASLFQTEIRIEPCEGTSLVPKPSRLFKPNKDSESKSQVTDEESGALLYRKVSEFAVGHVASADWQESDKLFNQFPTAEFVQTSWLPSAIVESVDPNGHPFFSDLGGDAEDIDPFSAYALSNATLTKLQAGLRLFCKAYDRWVKLQWQRLNDETDVKADLKYVAKANLEQCVKALERIEASVDEMGDNPRLLRAFQLANLAMHLQHSWDSSKSQYGPLRWRPFQLGFLLLSAPSASYREHHDREIMDLLWFPTGGGKTEAYLALIACVAVYRRLSEDARDHNGVCALMRYTLRLLTTQQFARSASMIVALEAIRKGKVDVPDGLQLRGDDPFSIGLWVGGDATPNKRADAFSSLRGASEQSSPKQLSRCPACGDKLTWTMSSAVSPVNVECINDKCKMCGPLPIYTVDEDIYEGKPTLLIGTADKFAQIVREKKTNKLFGISDGSPPDLIIQDELHLISGPLGTIAGIYEAAFDLMFAVRGYKVKIIGSTATIRRASEQVQALFDREAFQFPPPAIDHYDSGFAVRDSRPFAMGRRYIGVTTAGRSAKFSLQAVAGSLLQTAFGAFSDDVHRDSYWTLVGYFNSLRELGGALVLMQDDVTDSIALYASTRPNEEKRPLSNVEELTSRRTQEDIRIMLDKLEIKAGSPGAVDTVLATNMVSVGVDISRLGLMLVNGQPKTIAEYIQSTSRVGRGEVSGLVVSLLNNAKARDRSHYESFCGWHRTLYRDVEATSVTPFAPRARDRALHAALVAVVRHLIPNMLDSPHMDDAAEETALKLIDKIVERANRIDPEETGLRKELERRLDSWRARSPEVYWSEFKGNKSLLQSAERAAARRAAGRDAGAAWPTLNSMRSVEAGTPFRMAPVLKGRSDRDEE